MAGLQLQNTTWHRSSNIIAQIMGKPVTGYHLYFATQQVFMLFLGLVTLYPYIENTDGLFLLFASYFPIWNVIEDFGWFVLNPYFGVKNFHKNKIWWHHNNHFINDQIPIMYLNGFGISMVLGFLSGHFVEWLQFVSYSGLLHVWSGTSCTRISQTLHADADGATTKRESPNLRKCIVREKCIKLLRN